MNKFFTTLAAAAFCAALSAEIAKNPDPNTLWIEKGKNIKKNVYVNTVKKTRENLVNSTKDPHGLTHEDLCDFIYR